MKAIETKLKGCFIFEPSVFEDERGCFFESYNQNKFNELIGEEVNFVQDNQSFSTKGVVRALHYQIGKHAQAKLVRVLEGKVIDVAVDLRKDSPTFGEHVTIELSADNKKQLYIPRGFAHGFSVISNTATFFYKCDNFYNKTSEGGIIFNDKSLNINWRLPLNEVKVSDKDIILPTIKNAIL